VHGMPSAQVGPRRAEIPGPHEPINR